MSKESGHISVHSENILPIIKKWLYSDRDIFLRELVSNGIDAITKYKHLCSIGEAELPEGEEFQVEVVVNPDAKTIQIIDNGIGMTDEEIRKYINQVAFSGAQDFIKKYEQKGEGGIIGHFGLGFYSAFMVSSKVTIDTLSYQKDAQPVCWSSEGGSEYEMEESTKTTRGTIITLHLAEDSQDLANVYKLREILNKYCSFLPVPIFSRDETKPVTDDDKDKDEDAGKPVNDIHPLWMKPVSECTEQDYKDFYRKVFADYREPLFWIHLNVDYPFNLKGILYFPRWSDSFDTMEGQIKLFSNQVFVADNIKEVIPEFLMLLKGVIDCPDLPLNVSRSFLQNDGFVSKIRSHIAKKVSDKLKGMFNVERDNYNKYWSDINPFVKYGCMRDDKFYEAMQNCLIFKNMAGEYVTLDDYLKANEEKHGKTVFYITDEIQQAHYISLFKENELDAVYLTHMIDPHFVTFLETKHSDVSFKRIDSELADSLKGDVVAEEGFNDKVIHIFKEVTGNEEMDITVEALKTDDVPAMVLLSEQNRRMREMMRQYGAPMEMGGDDETILINSNNRLIKRIVELHDTEGREEDMELLCQQVLDLAMLSHKPLAPEAMNEFIKRSQKILSIL